MQGYLSLLIKVCFPQSHQINEEQIFKGHHFVEIKEYLVRGREKVP